MFLSILYILDARGLFRAFISLILHASYSPSYMSLISYSELTLNCTVLKCGRGRSGYEIYLADRRSALSQSPSAGADFSRNRAAREPVVPSASPLDNESITKYVFTPFVSQYQTLNMNIKSNRRSGFMSYANKLKLRVCWKLLLF